MTTTLGAGAGATLVLDDRALRDLSAACRLDLTMFRRSHVQARVERAFGLEELSGVEELRDRLYARESARNAFRRSVAISVTGLFRDPEQFDVLADVLGATPSRVRPLRAWSAGCATGEEAWSIAATLARVGRAEGATVLGSDLLPENIRIARALAPSPADLGGHAVADRVRVRFECRDLVNDGVAGGGWDLVLCRNVAIYLAPEQRAELHHALADSVRTGGLLMLGRSERLHEPAKVGLVRVAPHVYRRCA